MPRRSSWLHLLGEPFLTHKPHFFEPLFLNPRSFFLTPPPIPGSLWRTQWKAMESWERLGSVIGVIISRRFDGNLRAKPPAWLSPWPDFQPASSLPLPPMTAMWFLQQKNTLPGWRALNPKLSVYQKYPKSSEYGSFPNFPSLVDVHCLMLRETSLKRVMVFPMVLSPAFNCCSIRSCACDSCSLCWRFTSNASRRLCFSWSAISCHHDELDHHGAATPWVFDGR